MVLCGNTVLCQVASEAAYCQFVSKRYVTCRYEKGAMVCVVKLTQVF